MANNFVFKDSLPVAPLKIAALESCKSLAAKVNDHIVQFRRNDIEELMRRRTFTTAGTTWIPICFTAAVPDSEQARAKLSSMNP